MDHDDRTHLYRIFGPDSGGLAAQLDLTTHRLPQPICDDLNGFDGVTAYYAPSHGCAHVPFDQDARDPLLPSRHW